MAEAKKRGRPKGSKNRKETRGRPKGSKNKPKMEEIAAGILQDKEGKKYYTCTCCGRPLEEKHFYNSYSIANKAIKKCNVCKECMLSLCQALSEESSDIKVGVFRTCRTLDYPYLEGAYQGALKSVKFDVGVTLGENARKVFGQYMKNINSLPQYRTMTFENGDNVDVINLDEIKDVITPEDAGNDRDKANEDKVLKDLGYDPFESENQKDRKYLFNRLVDFLDDSTLNDNLLLLSVIEIVKGFNQIDKINEMIAKSTYDISKLANNTGNIKSLIDAKKNLMTTILKTAEDNGISTKFNTTKSKGAGTLSGIMKKLNDLGLEDAKINTFDILTSQSMKQIADISHKSIMEQLMFTESEYTEMIADQKDMILKLDEELEYSKELIRKLKIYIKSQGFSLDEIENVIELEDADFTVEEDNESFGVISVDSETLEKEVKDSEELFRDTMSRSLIENSDKDQENNDNQEMVGEENDTQ